MLCDRLFRLAQRVDPEPGPARGRRFEQTAEAELVNVGFPVRAVPSGVEVFGTLPASGMRHQIDAEAWCGDCDVIAEWKAYISPVPKSELLLFKAKTDDIFSAMIQRRLNRRPLVRVFGMAGDTTREARGYAAQHGIVLVERSRWPAPVLGDPLSSWTGADPYEFRALHYLARPLQHVYRLTADGRWLSPKQLPDEVLAEVLHIHDAVSERFQAGLAREVG